ncbi:MAG: DNRLRE domain-containing protein [Bacteroidota bacterium]
MRYFSTLLLMGLLCVVLPAQINTLTLQPDQDCAKETFIWRLTTQTGRFGTTEDNTYNGVTYLPIMNWTWDGAYGQRMVLIDFLHNVDIPSGTEIIEARLSLFAPEEPTPDAFHSLESITGLPANGLIQSVTSPWEDATVTWNTRPTTSSQNEFVIPAPSSETQNYVDLDITDLIQDQVTNQSYGQLITLQEPDFYRKLIFAGSGNPNPDIRPRLVITYSGPLITPPLQEGCIQPEECELVFPDIFSPNQDGVNDEFRAFFEENCTVEEFSLLVYNRWGQKVYESSNPAEAWIGNLNDKAAGSDLYIYQAQYRIEGIEGVRTKTGQLTLVR